jgi:hypothetical protein
VHLLLAAALLQASPAPSPSPTPDPRLREYCSLVRACGLQGGAVTCAPEVSTGVPGVKYDEERCRPARTLVGRGVGPEAPRHYAVFRFLGRRYQVLYEVAGELAIGAERLSYLLDDLPLAARLLTHFQGVKYTAEYTDADHARLKASREGTMTAKAERLSGSTSERLLYYFGHGTSKLGPWKLRGQALVEVSYAPAPAGRGLAYRIRILATPANAVVNAFMGLGLFRSALRGKVEEVLTDIAQASAKLDEQGLAGASAAAFTEDERRRIAALLARPG